MKKEKGKEISCEVCGKKTNSPAIIRTYRACGKCFMNLKEDNFKRINKGMNIKKSIVTLEEDDELKRFSSIFKK